MNSKTNFLGIDLGLYGAFWCLNSKGDVGLFLDMPLENKKINLIKAKEYFENFNPENTICIVEKVFFSKFLKGKKGWTFGRNTMAIETLLFALGFKVEMVTPKEWHDYFGIGIKKNESIKKAIQLYPKSKDKFVYKKGTRKIRKDGRADACLLAEYGKRNF